MKPAAATLDPIIAARPAPATTRWALTGLALAMLLSSLGTSIANVALPALAQAFAASFQAVQWVVLAYLLAVTTLIVSVGRLGDLHGRRRLLILGTAVFTAASALGGFAPTLGWLIAARAAQGLGAAAMMALTLAFVGDTVAKSEVGRAMGLLGTMSALGTALGPSLGGYLIAVWGWPTIFLVNVPLGLGALLLIRNHLPPERRPSPEPSPNFDAIGTVLLAFALGAYALAMTLGRGSFGAANLGLLAVATLAIGLFIYAELRVPAPLVRLVMLRERTLLAGLATSGLVATVMMTTLVVGPFYLAISLGLGPAAVGLVLSVGPLVAATMSVPAGRWTDRLGAPRVAKAGLTGIAGGTALLALLPAPGCVAGYIGPIVVITLGYALFQTANNTIVMRAISADQRGVASGLLNLARNLGLITGASAMGAVFALGAGTTALTQASPEALAAGMRVAFGVAAGLMLVALGLPAVLRRSRVAP